MTIFGIDISSWQKGLNLTQVAAGGFRAVIAKATEGSGYINPEYRSQKSGTERTGMKFMAYHYVRDTSPAAQVDNFVRVEPDRGVPVMLDHELNPGGVGVLRAVYDEFVRRGYRVPLTYLPRWYWQGHIGSPDLSGLPPLMASHYGQDLPGFASLLYPGADHVGWSGYGGNTVAVLQLTQKARVAGQLVDAWAVRSEKEFDALFGAGTEDDMSAEDVATQLMGGDRKGFAILGKAVETTSGKDSRNRYLTEAVAVILTQLAGGPNFEGWPQLGTGEAAQAERAKKADAPRRTQADAIAHLIAQNERIIELLEGLAK